MFSVCVLKPSGALRIRTCEKTSSGHAGDYNWERCRGGGRRLVYLWPPFLRLDSAANAGTFSGLSFGRGLVGAIYLYVVARSPCGILGDAHSF